MLNKFIFDFLLATQRAALASSKLCGAGDNNAADHAAVKAMRDAINIIDANIKVAIGEGERDKAPMLYISEQLGFGGAQELEIAVDPLEGTNLCANFGPGALSVLGFAKKGVMLNAPDVYMQKIFTDCRCDISLNNKIEENLEIVASAKKKQIKDLCVTILQRKRHEQLIGRVRGCGAKVKLIEDGDIAAILSIITQKKQDIYAGIGGAPEGVLAAIAVKNLGGSMQSKLIFESEEQKARATGMGVKDFSALYSQDDMINGDAILVATGVTTGEILDGVTESKDGFSRLQSLIVNDGGYSKVLHFLQNATKQ